MTRSLAIQFRAGELILSTVSAVEGYDAVIQNCLVNLLTDNDTDIIFPDKGTTLFEEAVNGAIYDISSATHICNFAASDTLFFSREYEVADSKDKIENLILQPAYLNNSQMDVQTSFESVDGRLRSFQLNTSAT